MPWHRLSLAFALVMVLSASPALETAKKHLAKGQFDEVAFDFEGAPVADPEKADAAKVLAQASKLALEAKDSVIALHCAQKALKLAPREAFALEAGARAAFAEQQFADAETYADGWILADPKSASAHLLRAELAAEAGEWDRVLEELKGKRFEGGDATKASALEKKAKAEKTVKDREQTGKREVPAPPSPAAVVAPVERPAEVVVYGTSWCGWCKRTRQWLDERSIPFVDKDVERDPGAAEELARKAEQRNTRARGVPWVDARGTLVKGFDPAAMSEALGL
jgi:glutaredoxin